MKKRLLSLVLVIAIIFTTLSCGIGSTVAFAASAPTGMTGSGLSIAWYKGTAETDLITMSSTSGTFSGTYYLKLTNNSTMDVTLKSITASSSYVAFSSTTGTIASGETKSITVTKGTGMTSATSGTVYKCNVVVNYTMANLYDAGTSTLQALTAKSSIGLEYIAAGAVAVPYTLKNPSVGYEVHIKTKTTATGGWLETTTSHASGTQNASVSGNYYVDYSKYSTWNGAGWKIASTESKGNNLDVKSSSCSISGTYASQGSISISFPAIKKEATVTASPTGTIPKGSTSSTSAAVLNFYVQWETGSVLGIGRNNGSLTGKINVYSYDKTNLRSKILSCEKAGIMSCYVDSTLYSTYVTALGNARQILARTKTNNKAVNDAYTALNTAYSNLISSSNRVAYCCTSNHYFYEGERTGTRTGTYTCYRVCDKSTETLIPYYTTYKNTSNRRSEEVSVTLTANTSKTYYYWTVNETALLEAVEQAKAVLEGDLSSYTDESVATLQTAYDAAPALLVEGSDTPYLNEDITEAATAITTAITNLAYKGADYSAVDEAIKKVEALEADDYYDFTEVNAAVLAVKRDLNITKQSEVDAFAQKINEEIGKLVPLASLLKVNRATATKNGDTITLNSYVNVSNIAISPNLKNGESITFSEIDGFKIMADGRVVAKEDSTAKIKFEDGREYNLVFNLVETEINVGDLKTMSVNTDSIKIDNEKKTIYMESNNNAQHVVIYNVTTTGIPLTINDAELYTTYRYKIERPNSQLYTSTLTLQGVEYALTVRFMPYFELNEGNLKTIIVSDASVDNEKRTIILNSADNAKSIVLYNVTTDKKAVVLENGNLTSTYRYTIDKPESKVYEGKVTIGGIDYALKVNFIEVATCDDFAYEIEGGDIILRKYTGTEENVTIPATLKVGGNTYNVVVGKVVLELAEDGYLDPVDGPFYANQIVKSVTFRDGVKVEDGNAEYMFMNTNIEEVYNIPEGTVDMYAMFYACASLKTVDSVPSTVKIMQYAFGKCRQLGGELEIKAADVTDIDNTVFYKVGINPLTIYVPAESATYEALKNATLSVGVKLETK